MSAEEVPFDERLDAAVVESFGQQKYMLDGQLDYVALGDVLFDKVVPAEAKKRSERAKVCVTRRDLMNTAFPKVVGPEGWADEDDEVLAEELYKRLDSTCWRMMHIAPSAPIQARLNSEHGLVLCRTTVNPHRTQAVYVTRALDCLLEDAIRPQQKRQQAAAVRDAAFAVMLIERIPEHGKRFDRELIGGLRTALKSAQAISAGALDAHDDDDEDDVDVDE